MFNSQFYPLFPAQGNYASPATQYQLMLQEAQQQIHARLQAQFASTSYPIDGLNGSAHTAAVLAAIGGGAVSAGGGGVAGGLQVLLQYAFAAGAYYGFQQGLNCQHWQ